MAATPQRGCRSAPLPSGADPMAADRVRLLGRHAPSFPPEPNYLALFRASQIAITALLALSLDLILGYAGIVSLGHAVFFGLGAYTAGILSTFGWGDPLLGLAAGAVVAGLFGYVI